MQKKPSQEDPSSQWPEEVKKAYEQLEVPSLFDFILTNEKLSLEIRKQSKDLRGATEELQIIHAKLNSLVDIFNEDLEIYDEDDEDDESENPESLTDLELDFLETEQEAAWENARALLMETADSLVDLSKSTKQIANQLLSLLPQKEDGASQASTYRPLSEELTRTLVDQVDNVRYKLIMSLKEWNIQMIEPQPGDVFNSQKHHALEHIIGGVAGTIARVIRAGYKQGDIILRSADVVVYV